MINEELVIKNTISVFLQRNKENISTEYQRLYKDIPNEEMQVVFSTLHDSLNIGFSALNLRLPTRSETAHFWADESRILLAKITEVREIQRALSKTSLAFEVIYEYEEAMKLCETFLETRGGSTIPPNTNTIQKVLEYPIFKLKTKNEIQKKVSFEYYSLQQIGEGSYAKVFKYKDTFYNKHFALKRANKKLDSKELTRFKQEYEIMSQMKHPCILEVFSYNNKLNEYIMEYVKYTLKNYIDTYSNKLTNQSRILIGRQIIKAFQYIHNKGLLHRDISPNNILVKQYDDTVMIKVSDFGLVKNPESNLTSLETEVKGSFNDFSDLSKIGFSNYRFYHEIFAISKILYFVATGCINIDREQKCLFLEKGTSGNVTERYASLEALEEDFLDFMTKK